MKAVSLYDLKDLARFADAIQVLVESSDDLAIGFGELEVQSEDGPIGWFLWDDKSEQVVFKPGKVK